MRQNTGKPLHYQNLLGGETPGPPSSARHLWVKYFAPPPSNSWTRACSVTVNIFLSVWYIYTLFILYTVRSLFFLQTVCSLFTAYNMFFLSYIRYVLFSSCMRHVLVSSHVWTWCVFFSSRIRTCF